MKLYSLFLLASLIMAVSTAEATAEEADPETYYGKPPTPPPQNPPPYGHTPPPPPQPHPYPPTAMPSGHPCVTKCEAHCAGARKKRPCMKACTACCGKFHCVPGPYEKCDNWTFVDDKHYGKVKCP